MQKANGLIIVFSFSINKNLKALLASPITVLANTVGTFLCVGWLCSTVTVFLTYIVGVGVITAQSLALSLGSISIVGCFGLCLACRAQQ